MQQIVLNMNDTFTLHKEQLVQRANAVSVTLDYLKELKERNYYAAARLETAIQLLEEMTEDIADDIKAMDEIQGE